MDTQIEVREIIRCFGCGLNQYRLETNLCRRCKQPYEVVPVPEPIEVLIQQPNPASAHIGDRIKVFRLRCGFSQRHMAILMSCPRTYISKLENHRAIPTVTSCQRIAVALGIEIWMLAPNRMDIRQAQIATILKDPLLSELAEWLPRLNKGDRMSIERAARIMSAGGKVGGLTHKLTS